MTVVQLLTDLKEKTDVYFGLGSIGILFLCAFLFWCVYKEKSRMMKVYVWYLGIACIFMLNPLSLYVIDKTRKFFHINRKESRTEHERR